MNALPDLIGCLMGSSPAVCHHSQDYCSLQRTVVKTFFCSTSKLYPHTLPLQHLSVLYSIFIWQTFCSYTCSNGKRVHQIQMVLVTKCLYIFQNYLHVNIRILGHHHLTRNNKDVFKNSSAEVLLSSN